MIFNNTIINLLQNSLSIENGSWSLTIGPECLSDCEMLCPWWGREAAWSGRVWWAGERRLQASSSLLKTGWVLWPWWIRNSIQQLLEIDFPSGDLTSCFTSRGDQTVLGGVSELAFEKALPCFLFTFFLFNSVSKGIFDYFHGLNTTSLNPSWTLEL